MKGVFYEFVYFFFFCEYLDEINDTMTIFGKFIHHSFTLGHTIFRWVRIRYKEKYERKNWGNLKIICVFMMDFESDMRSNNANFRSLAVESL